MKQEKEYLTVVSIVAGIITLLDYSGQIQTYRQRGITRLTEEQQRTLISMGFLQRDWELYEELPNYIELSYEDPTLMGKASKRYPIAKDIAKVYGEI